MAEEGELIEDLCKSFFLSRRETYLISDVGAVSILSRFSAFFNELVEHSLYLIVCVVVNSPVSSFEIIINRIVHKLDKSVQIK